ncbi:MAG: aldehyde dehydrogenase family protein, partial [Pseudomonadota bacterium]
IVACISPWNLPLYLLTWKIAPALAAGNCVLAKPSEFSPVTAHLLSEACIEAGMPSGVLSVLHGRGPSIGQAVVEAPAVRAISFTGGTQTGRQIAATAAPRFVRLALELGGKNPTIIFADADLDEAAELAITAAFRNQGEICLCGSRILVERSVYEDVRKRLIQRTEALSVGDPLTASTDQGALISEGHMNKVLSAIEQGRQSGGKVLCGGERVRLTGPCADGFFVAPTLIDGLGPECSLNQEEVFGPVATLLPFDSEAQAVALANGTAFGLAASVFSRDVGRCHRVAAQLQSGLVWVNTWMLRDLRTPMGGMKQSGVGREGGVEAMRFFTEPTNVCIKY